MHLIFGRRTDRADTVNRPSPTRLCHAQPRQPRLSAASAPPNGRRIARRIGACAARFAETSVRQHTLSAHDAEWAQHRQGSVRRDRADAVDDAHLFELELGGLPETGTPIGQHGRRSLWTRVRAVGRAPCMVSCATLYPVRHRIPRDIVSRATSNPVWHGTRAELGESAWPSLVRGKSSIDSARWCRGCQHWTRNAAAAGTSDSSNLLRRTKCDATITGASTSREPAIARSR